MWMFKTRARIYAVHNTADFIFQSPGDSNLMNLYLEYVVLGCFSQRSESLSYVLLVGSD